MQVEKKNGKIVDFDKTKIYNAIVKAMSETTQGIDENLSNDIEIHKNNIHTISISLKDEILDTETLCLKKKSKKKREKYILSFIKIFNI